MIGYHGTGVMIGYIVVCVDIVNKAIYRHFSSKDSKTLGIKNTARNT